jgi:hypothetical protein
MTIRASTGIRDAMMGTVGHNGALANGVLDIYSGAQPASADAAITGTLLARITLDGGAFTPGSPTNGLNWDTPSNGSVSKPGADTWSGVGLAAGTAGWARFKGNAADNDGTSTTLPRVDFSVGKTSGDIRIPNINIAIGDPVIVNDATMTLPAQK